MNGLSTQTSTPFIPPSSLDPTTKKPEPSPASPPTLFGRIGNFALTSGILYAGTQAACWIGGPTLSLAGGLTRYVGENLVLAGDAASLHRNYYAFYALRTLPIILTAHSASSAIFKKIINKNDAMSLPKEALAHISENLLTGLFIKQIYSVISSEIHPALNQLMHSTETPSDLAKAATFSISLPILMGILSSCNIYMTNNSIKEREKRISELILLHKEYQKELPESQFEQIKPKFDQEFNDNKQNLLLLKLTTTPLLPSFVKRINKLESDLLTLETTTR